MTAAAPVAVAQAGQPLFARLLGDAAFTRLPAALRTLHGGHGTRTLHGEVEVVRARGPFAACAAWLTRLPPSLRGTIAVTIESVADGETWRRDFAGHRMVSRLSDRDAHLHERVGPARLVFGLDPRTDGMDWHVVGARVFGTPVPARWFAGVHARESQDAEGRYRFDAGLAFGDWTLIRYRGWLDVRA
ncbi:DUF4166 domain-containing protein [Dokdonella sp. MW10]|uniref:DUF4166 domain-containing protein n=1 Tax=Dokdonella sp. MW10 TaxID=2992926 RepID=UPI003F7FC825